MRYFFSANTVGGLIIAIALGFKGKYAWLLMNWKVKALVQKTVSCLPFRDKLYYQMQRRLQKSLPYPEDILNHRFTAVESHLRVLSSMPQWQTKHVLEIGPGWDLFGATNLVAMGLHRCHAWDLNPLFRPELFNSNLQWMEKRHGQIFSPLGTRWKEELVERFKVIYRSGPRVQSVISELGKIDFVCSTSVLEHIPQEQLEDLLEQLKPSLAPGAVISSAIDLSDHFCHGDGQIGPYNFLRYPKSSFWANNHFVYQNRMRRSDYVDLFRRHGFNIEVLTESRPKIDFAQSVSPYLHEDFRQMDPRDVSVTHMHILARL